jgi:cysteine desulfurase
MAANNETGVVQPIAEVARLAREHGALVFCDAVQAVGKTGFDVGALGVDLAAVSAHKLGGPQGAGALYVGPGAAVAPIIAGRQERGLRGGTENLAAIAGFAAAAKAALAAMAAEAARIGALRGRLEAAVLAATPGAVVIGAGAPRLAGTSAIAVPGASAETLVIALDLAGVAVSAGAACSSGKVGPSHVLAAMGLGRALAGAAIRVSLGWSTTAADIDAFLAAWADAARPVLARAVA